MSSGVSKTMSVAATARQTGNDVYVTWQGGQDNLEVATYHIRVTSSSGRTFNSEDLPPAAGDMSKFNGAGTSGSDHVVVMATATDGRVQVILDTYV